jgi:hypothetical protein
MLGAAGLHSSALGSAVIDIRARRPMLDRMIRETVEFAQTAAGHTQSSGIFAEDKSVVLAQARRGNCFQVHTYKR